MWVGLTKCWLDELVMLICIYIYIYPIKVNFRMYMGVKSTHYVIIRNAFETGLSINRSSLET